MIVLHVQLVFLSRLRPSYTDVVMALGFQVAGSNVRCIYIYIYIERERDVCIHIYIYIYREREMYIYIYIYIHTYTHIHIYIYIYTHQISHYITSYMIIHMHCLMHVQGMIFLESYGLVWTLMPESGRNWFGLTRFTLGPVRCCPGPSSFTQH